MDFPKLITRYKQFGGAKLVWQYAKLGAVPTVLKELWRFTVKGSWFKVGVFQCFKGLYGEIIRKVDPFLIQKYGSRIQEFKKFNGSRELTHEHPKVVWWCWLQGKEQAPHVVQACYNSLKRSLPGYEIRVIDVENWKEYIDLPDYIVKKWEKNHIPPAFFSDLLRLQLLITHGGTWIDSTVLCTLDSSPKIQDSSANKYMNADLFLFQYTPEGTTNDISISNWFISAHSNNEVLMTLRDMLFAYWKDYDYTLDYYIFHLFFSKVAREFPEQVAAIPYGYSMNSLVLLHHWGETFNQKKWDKLTENVCFHKLAFRIGDEVKSNKENYYNHILEAYGGI